MTQVVSVETAPVGEVERLDALDLLRGAAVLGILIVNMQLFAMPNAATLNPFALGPPSNSDVMIWSVIQVFADSKFMTIFSILFGAGVVLMTGRLEQRGMSAGRLHYRRMGWLLVFGLVHAYVLWHGDILVDYAICGMLVYLARRLPARTLAAIGIAMLLIGTSISLVSGLAWSSWPEAARADWQLYWQPAPADIAAETAAFQGGWLAQEAWRASYSRDAHLGDTVTWAIWRAGGLMLLGMALLKWDVLTGRRTPRYYAALTAIGLGGGLPIATWGLREFHALRSSVPDVVFLVPLWNYWASILVALGYVGLLLMMWKARVMRGFASRLVAIGRTAFSCYIFETLICTGIFYGHGWGWFGTVDRLQQLLITVLVWIVLLIVAPLWLGRFRYGPLEWLWRTLTYGRAVPMTREVRPWQPVA